MNFEKRIIQITAKGFQIQCYHKGLFLLRDHYNFYVTTIGFQISDVAKVKHFVVVFYFKSDF